MLKALLKWNFKKNKNKKCYKVLKTLYSEFLSHSPEAHDGLEIGLKKTGTNLDKFDPDIDYKAVMNDCWRAIRELHRDARDFGMEKDEILTSSFMGCIFFLN